MACNGALEDVSDATGINRTVANVVGSGEPVAAMCGWSLGRFGYEKRVPNVNYSVRVQPP
jgi:hypothetical protein